MAPKRQVMLGAVAVGTVIGGAVALGGSHGTPPPIAPTAAKIPTAGLPGSDLVSLRAEEAQLQSAILAARQKLGVLVTQQAQSQSALTQKAQELVARENELTQEASRLDAQRSTLEQEAARLAVGSANPPATHATTGASAARSSDDGGGGDG